MRRIYSVFMKSLRVFIVIALSIVFGVVYASGARKVIFDTDMGSDIDDALALLVLLDYHKAGKIDLAGITISKDNAYSSIYTDVVNNFYGYKNIPIAVVREGIGKDDGCYTRASTDLKDSCGRYVFSRNIDATCNLEEAVHFLRRTLASLPEGEKATLVVVGFATNLARLLESGPDNISPLDGTSLVKEKVDFISMMAANFDKASLENPQDSRPEWNVLMDPRSAKTVFERCPVDIVFSGFEVGKAVRFPHDKIDEVLYGNPTNPVKISYDAHARTADKKTGRHNRPCWDLTSALYAADPDCKFFELSERGKVSLVNNKGSNSFTPDKSGRDRYLILKPENIQALTDKLVELCSLKPNGM